MATRRELLATATVAAAGAGVAAAPAPARAALRPRPASPASPAGSRIPRTLARTRTNGAERVNSTPFPLTHLGIVLPAGRSAAAAVRMRTRAGWGPWRTLTGRAHGWRGCAGGRDGRSGPVATLLAVPGAVGYELSAPAAAVTEINTVDGPAGALAAPPAAQALIGGRPVRAPYLSRRAWGADESLRFGPGGAELFPQAFFPVQTLTVHHTAGANEDPDPAATVRAIYFFQAVTNGFGDIGYHLLIDEAGRLYEGRVSGTDALPVFGPEPTADGRPQMSNAAHVSGFNAGNVGVSLLGDFTARQPTAAARLTLVRTLAALSVAGDLDPLGRTAYVNPISGATANVDTIGGHRDWMATECPGNTFHPTLPRLRRDVADHRTASGAWVAASRGKRIPPPTG